MPEWPHPTVLWTIHYFLLSFKGKLSWACWEAKYTADMNYSSDCKGRIYKGSWETWKPAKLTSAGLVIWTSAGQEASTSSFEALWCFYQRVEHNTKRNLLVFINEIRDMVTVQVVIVQGYRNQQEQESKPLLRWLLPAAWGKRGPVFWWESSCC